MRAGLPDILRRRFDPAGRYGLRLTLFAIAIVLVAVPFGLLLEQVVRVGPLVEIDTLAANYLHQWVREAPNIIGALVVISFVGKPIWFFIMVSGACMVLLLRGRRRLVAYLITTCLVGGAVDMAVKMAVSRPRPSLKDPVAMAFGQSFPSGHAMMSLVTYFALLLALVPFIPRRWRVPSFAAAGVLVAAIGFSRLALGVHYISDVLGGFVLGLAWLAASTAAFEIWRAERGREPVTDVVHEGVEPEAKVRS